MKLKIDKSFSDVTVSIYLIETFDKEGWLNMITILKKNKNLICFITYIVLYLCYKLNFK